MEVFYRQMVKIPPASVLKKEGYWLTCGGIVESYQRGGMILLHSKELSNPLPTTRRSAVRSDQKQTLRRSKGRARDRLRNKLRRKAIAMIPSDLHYRDKRAGREGVGKGLVYPTCKT